ncbi:AAA family ATPase [Nocardioides sp. SR21]|uniref:AAA family ATPase n=1 Tax=Nocardioides sp. SR21 TaxID=2919501 RepID=UPI001FAAA374|nr:AAA family ATPase [Nocardioides sp. SR21]
MLSATDPLPVQPSRVAVAGVSGSGKSTLARRIGALLDLPYTETDSLFHGPGWTRMPTFEAEVQRLADSDRWVCEWQYDDARPVLLARADLMVWVDPPFPVTLTRVVRRTVRRRVRREELWNGNREGPLRAFFTDPEHVVRWSISTRNVYDERMPVVVAERPDLPIVRLRSSREVETWLRLLAAAQAG